MFIRTLKIFLTVIFIGLNGPAHAADLSPVLGQPSAPVTIEDYSSLTCPHCADFHVKTLPTIKKDLIDTGKAKLVFRDFPLDKTALQASVLAHCAPQQQFYPLLDVLFGAQGKWARDADPVKALTAYGVLAGVSPEQFQTCLKDKKIEDQILAQQLEAQKANKIEATPTFILRGGKNGKATKILTGEMSAADFEAAVKSVTP